MKALVSHTGQPAGEDVVGNEDVLILAGVLPATDEDEAGAINGDGHSADALAGTSPLKIALAAGRVEARALVRTA